MADVVISYIGGQCPVQAAGTINGAPFYFRARGNWWSMGIGNDPVAVAMHGATGWCRQRQYGTDKYAAGYMPVDEARRFIAECAEDYERGVNGAYPSARETDNG